MKKTKKYFPLVIGCIILLSVVAYGTRAWFTDSTSEEAGIELKLGNIDITSTPTEWKYTGDNTQLKDNHGNLLSGKELGYEKSINNVLPGDSFTKTFTFENKSSLPATFTFTEDITELEKGPFSISMVVNSYTDNNGNRVEASSISLKDIKENNKGYPLYGGESATVELTVSIKEDLAEEKYNYDGDKNNMNLDDFTLNLFEKTIQVDLVQAE